MPRAPDRRAGAHELTLDGALARAELGRDLAVAVTRQLLWIPPSTRVAVVNDSFGSPKFCFRKSRIAEAAFSASLWAV